MVNDTVREFVEAIFQRHRPMIFISEYCWGNVSSGISVDPFCLQVNLPTVEVGEFGNT